MLSVAEVEALQAAARAAAQRTEVVTVPDLQLDAVLATARSLLNTLQEHGNAGFDADHLLACLRVLRNACAAGVAAADHLAAAGLAQLLATLLDLVGSAALALNWNVPQAAAQLLANSAQASRACAAAAWQHLFPHQLTTLAHIHGGSTQAATAAALLACCRQVPEAPAALAGPEGAAILAALLCGQHRVPDDARGNDMLGILVVHLCLVRGLLPEVWSSLASGGSSDHAAAPTVEPTLAHVVLLQELCSEAELDAPPAPPDGGTSDAGGASAPVMAILLRLIEGLAAVACSTPLSEGQQQVLQDALQLVRDIAARDDDGRGLAGGDSLVEGLLQAGAVPLLLAMLKALPQAQPGAGTGQPPQQHRQPGTASDSGLAPALAARAAGLPTHAPYTGYRTDVLSVLANLAYRRPAVQAEVQALKGVVLVLAQCQLDEAAPLAREWALWAVRNLCEGSAAARDAIAELQVLTAVDSEDLRRAGVRLELDGRSKLRVVPR